jgi:hypothetical protein
MYAINSIWFRTLWVRKSEDDTDINDDDDDDGDNKYDDDNDELIWYQLKVCQVCVKKLK